MSDALAICVRTLPWAAGLSAATCLPSSWRLGPMPVYRLAKSPWPNLATLSRTSARRRLSMVFAETVIVPLKPRRIMRTNRRLRTAAENADRPSAL